MARVFHGIHAWPHMLNQVGPDTVHAITWQPPQAESAMEAAHQTHSVPWGRPVQELLDSGRAPLKPLASARSVVWLWNEVGELLFGRLPRCRSLGEAWAAAREKAGVLARSKDALLDAADPLPFLGLHYMQVGCALQ